MHTSTFVIIFSSTCFCVGILLGRLFPRQRSASQERPHKQRGHDHRVEIYVGNLSYDIGDRDLSEAFDDFGEVLSARIIKNRLNGKSKGFGFVEMAGRSQSFAAIKALNGKDLKGRRLVVNEAKSRARD